MSCSARVPFLETRWPDFPGGLPLTTGWLVGLTAWQPGRVCWDLIDRIVGYVRD